MGLKSHVTNPNKPLNKYIIRKITNEYATANSLSKPNKEKKNISAASLVPIPENEIGRKLNNLLTDIIAKVKNKEIGIAKDFAIIYHWINKTNVESNVNEIAWIMLNIPSLVVKLFDIGIFNFSMNGLYKYFENKL